MVTRVVWHRRRKRYPAGLWLWRTIYPIFAMRPVWMLV